MGLPAAVLRWSNSAVPVHRQRVPETPLSSPRGRAGRNSRAAVGHARRRHTALTSRRRRLATETDLHYALNHGFITSNTLTCTLAALDAISHQHTIHQLLRSYLLQAVLQLLHSPLLVPYVISNTNIYVAPQRSCGQLSIYLKARY